MDQIQCDISGAIYTIPDSYPGAASFVLERGAVYITPEVSDTRPEIGEKITLLGRLVGDMNPGVGGGVHSTLRVRVCSAHMGVFSGPKFSKQGSLFRQIFLKRGWGIQKLAKNSTKWVVFRQSSS